ncbi:cell division protein PerM [Leucobacter sp.]
MRSLVTAAIAAIEAAAVALAGLVVIAIPALLLWVVTFDLAAEPATVLSVIGGIWLLAHWVPMGFQLDPETALGLGQAPEELSFTLSLAPLGITLITVLLAARAGWRFGGRGGTGAAGVLGGALGFGGVALVVMSAASPSTPWPAWLVVLVLASSYAVVAAAAFAVRAARDAHPWWTTALRGVQRGFEYLGLRGAAAFPARAAQTVLLATAAFAAVVGLAALALAVALVVGYPEVIGLTQNLQLDPLGSVLLFLAQLALLPVAVVWTGAWLSGAGFSAGAGTSVTPFETLLGPLPALPIFGAIPQGWGGLGALAPALLVLAGLGLGLLFALRPELRRARWGVALAIPVVSAALAGLAIAGVCALAGGSLGPERLAETGAHPWLAGGLVAAELAVGLLLGVTAGRTDYSRLRDALPDTVPGADALNRLRSGRGADPSGAEPRGADEQETVPLDDTVGGLRGLSYLPVAQETTQETDQPTTEVRPVHEAASPEDLEHPDAREASESGGAAAKRPVRETGIDAEPEVGTGWADPATGADGDRETGAEGTAGGSAADEESETDALLRAYAWDGGGEAGEQSADEARRTGWRWPRRKG